jgi:hypothetical protein
VTPACIGIQEKIGVAIAVVNQFTDKIAIDKKYAVQRLHSTPEYRNLQSQLADKLQEKTDALAKLRQDNESGQDTDHDVIAVKNTSNDWIKLSGQVTQMENDAATNDPAVLQSQRDVATTKKQLADLQNQLNSFIVREVSPLCDDASCHVNNIQLDPDRWALHIDVTPTGETKSDIAADVAMNCVGIILEMLHQSPFEWDTLNFRMYNEQKQLEFQLAYNHGTIKDTKFETTHENTLLYHPLLVDALRIGASGMLIDVRISQIIDHENMLVYLWDDSDCRFPVWVRGVDTTNNVDNENVDIDIPLKISRTIRYTTVMGGSKTVYLLEPTGFKQNVVIGIHFDDSKLVNLANNVWLNPNIDSLQGRPAIPNSYNPRPGAAAPQYVNTLDIGGYNRSDGTFCALLQLHTPHPVHVALTDTPKAKRTEFPGNSGGPDITNDNPMIIQGH